LSTLGIDLAVRAAHVATLTNEQGKVVWSKRRFRNCRDDLLALSDAAGPVDELTVVMEPTPNSWVLVAAHFQAAGAKVVLVAPEQSADLRRYYNKHVTNDRLDSVLLARLPLLHPDGLDEIADLGPADALKRTVRRRVKLVRLTAVLRRTSGGKWNVDQARRLLDAANEAIALWSGGGLDFTDLAWDLASEVRIIRQLDAEIDRLDERIAELYADADPKKIVLSAPGVGPVLAGGIRGRLSDADRFANLAAVRSFSGMVPRVNQSGNSDTRPGITKQGDPGLRRDLWFAAELARHPRPAARGQVLPTRRRPTTAPLLRGLSSRDHAAHSHRRVLAHGAALHRARHRRPTRRPRRSARDHRRAIHHPARRTPTIPRPDATSEPTR